MNSKEERDAGGKAALQAALHAWRGGAGMRARRRRYRDYTYGRQWADRVVSDQGKVMTEEEMAVRAGARPLTNNLIRQLVKCVTGNFRQSLRRGDVTTQESGEGGELTRIPVSPEWAGPDDATRMRNELDELDSRMLEEFLISGCAIQRVVNESRMDGDGVWVDNVSPDRFFVNRFTDPRGHDIEVVGMIHDYSLRETMMRFGGGSIGRAAEIERIYSRVAESGPEVSLGDSVGSDFFHSEAGRCRVIEVWARPSGVLPIKTTPNSKEPHQVISNAEHSGAYHLLDLQMQMLQQVSGISGALQGRLETANSSAALYDAQVRNSAVAILDLLESFNTFRRSRDILVAGV